MKHYLFDKITLEALVSYIEGSSDNTVIEPVERWLESDPQNKEFFFKFREIWINRDDLSELRKENIDKDFENIIRQIQTLESIKDIIAEPSKESRIYKILARAAAIIILVISIGTAYYLGRSVNPTDEFGKSLAYNELIVPKGQRSQLKLSDGTIVWLNAESKFRFPGKFTGKTREVWLDGEGYFEVAKDSSRLFYVHTSDLDVKVHGTVFNLKAYSNEDIIETTLVNGIVSFESNNPSIKKQNDIYLEPNRKAIFLKHETAKITEEVKRDVVAPLVPQKIIISKPVEVERDISWTEGKLIFSEESVGNIAVRLERKYNVIINIANDEIRNTRFTGTLKDIPIEQTLLALKLTTGIQYTIKDNIINISEDIK